MMNTTITARNFDLSEAIKESIETKLGKLEKYTDKDSPIKVVMETKRYGQKIEVSVVVNNSVVRAEAIEDSLYTSIDLVVEKLKHQIEKFQIKLKAKEAKSLSHTHMTDIKDDHSEPTKIIKRKAFDMKPMMEEEAVLQMELLGHDFFVFFNAEVEEVCVIYKRKDGNYGLIERYI